MYTQKSIVLCHNDVDDHDDGESTDDSDGNDEEEDVMQLLKQTKRGTRFVKKRRCETHYWSVCSSAECSTN